LASDPTTMSGGAGAGGAAGGDVWVFIEVAAGRAAGPQAAEVSLELLGKARELADQLGVRAAAVVPGAGVSSLARSLVAHGADVVYVADDPRLAHYLAQPYARLLAELIRQEKPQIVLYGATTTGRDVAPRVASALRTGLTADCTDLRIGDFATRERQYTNLLYQIRPAFGGNIIATIVSPEHRPQMATVREGVMRLTEPDQARQGEVVQVALRFPGEPPAGEGRSDGRPTVAFGDADFAVTLVRRVTEEKRVNLKGAQIIVAGGSGVGSKEGFALIHELAHVLGGVVGASRAAVDAGYVGREHQVGQTGTTVRPKLYIAAGISGSVQHRAGMDQSARILAINTDPQAPIFSVAHYGIVGDLHEVIPKLIHAYRSKSAPASAAETQVSAVETQVSAAETPVSQTRAAAGAVPEAMQVGNPGPESVT